jgi:hypothetical protein
MIGLFCEINVKAAFSVFSVEVIDGTKNLDQLVIVIDKMILRKIEVGTNAKVYEDLPIFMVPAATSSC